jgi:hypothetical protein
MASPSEGIKDILVAASIATFGPPTGTDWGLYVGVMPDIKDLSDRALSIFDTAWQTPNAKWLLDQPGIQVQVRGGPGDYQAAYDKAVEVKNALLGIAPQTVNGDLWDGIVPVGDISFIGYDNNRRPTFSVNFGLYIEPAVTAGQSREPL